MAPETREQIVSALDAELERLGHPRQHGVDRQLRAPTASPSRRAIVAASRACAARAAAAVVRAPIVAGLWRHCRRCRRPTAVAAAVAVGTVLPSLPAPRMTLALLRSPDDPNGRASASTIRIVTQSSSVRADEAVAGGYEPALRPPRRSARGGRRWRRLRRASPTRFALPPRVCHGVVRSKVEIEVLRSQRARTRPAGGRHARPVRPALLAKTPAARGRGAAVDAPYAKLEQLEPGIARVLAHNPSAFTYHGTQTYLVGERRSRGHRSRARSARASRRAGSRRSAGGRSRRSCAPTPTATTARRRGRWRSATGAPIIGCAPLALETVGPRADAAFDGDYRARPRARRRRSASRSTASRSPRSRRRATRRTISASPIGGALFTGDHVMGWSTTVVVPPDGDMAAYMASLDKLRQRDDRIYYPAHGPAGDQPAAICART